MLTLGSASAQIKACRKWHRKGLREAAREIGCSPTTMGRLERGEDALASRYFAALAWVDSLKGVDPSNGQS